MQTIPAPPPTRVEEVVETLHGRTIADPYRWLEDRTSRETLAWTDAQNAYTRSLLDAVPGREDIHRRLAELLSIGTVGAPAVRGDHYFYVRREGAQNQAVLYLRSGVEGEERVLLDPNEESAEGLVTLDWWYPSSDGRLLAYGLSRDGDEWSTLGVLDVARGERLPDRIERTRYASVAWLPDNSGFYYTRYPKPGDVPEGEENYRRRVFFHTLGADSQTDEEIWGRDLERTDMVAVDISRDGRWLILAVYKGPGRSDLYLRDLHAPDAEYVPVAVGHDALFNAEMADGALYIHTNFDAPNYRVFWVDPQHPEHDAWQEIIAEDLDAVLTSITLAGGRIVADYLRNATSALAVFSAEGERLREVELPALGTITSVRGEWDSADAFYSFESFIVPPTVYRLPLEGGESRVWAAVQASLDPAEYAVSQEWYTSKDGTRVSMFLVHHRDLDRSRAQPTVLTGYGGFNLSRTPLFERTNLLWVERGGIYALPNLRGGGEYGEEWHRAGRLDRKQNVFDDFIAAAEYLIEQGYTDTSKLGISGRSNGGLLVGAALTQRPELFCAVVCGVPLLDMVRYHHFLIAQLWIPEYGSANDPNQFAYLYAYSPYHHVVPGERYPAVLLFTAESDTRVDPLHARKMAALLQASTGSDRPILLRLEQHAGHGIGKPLAKVIEEHTDTWTFLFWQLGLQTR